MCEFCKTHGNKKKWYLNERNYYLKKVAISKKEYNERHDFINQWESNKGPFMKRIIKDSLSELRNEIDLKSNTVIGNNLKDDFYQEATKKVFNKFSYWHGGQVVPIEDAMVTIKLAPKIYKFNCVCRQTFRAIEKPVCLCFGELGDIMSAYPDYSTNHDKEFKTDLITIDEASEILKKEYGNSIPTLYYYKIPYIGALCNCSIPECPTLKNRVFGNATRSVIKGEYIAQISDDLCEGCNACISLCQFDAIMITKYGKCKVDITKCFGCGNCRATCDARAISLMPRDLDPKASGLW